MIVHFTHCKTGSVSTQSYGCPKATKEYVVRTDASDVGVGAVLMQEQDGDLFPVSYAS